MIQGKTRLEIIDSKTGEVKSAFEDKNIVTNAVPNILGGHLDALVGAHKLGGGSLQAVYSLPRGIAQDLFGGILLFSEPLTSDINHCIPTLAEMNSEIGHATNIPSVGAEYENSVYRGRYIESESVFDGKSAKFVYEFRAGVATGTVKAVALTSALGGMSGFKESITPKNTSIRPFVSNADSAPLSYKTTSIRYGSTAHNPLVKVAQTNDSLNKYMNGDTLYYYDKDSSAIKKFSIAKAKNGGISLLQNFNGGLESKNEVTTFSVTNTYGKYKGQPIKNLDFDALYSFSGTESNASNLVLNKVTGNGVESKVTIPMTELYASLKEYFPGIRLNSNVFDSRKYEILYIYKNKLYFCAGDINATDQSTRPTKLRIYSIDFSGKVMYNDIDKEEITNLFGTNIKGSKTSLEDLGLRFMRVKDTLYLTYTNGYVSSYYSYLRVNPQDLKVTKSSFMFTEGDNLCDYGCTWDTLPVLKEPWVSCYDLMFNTDSVFSVELFTGYLATINNLTQSVVKGEGDALKVTYTLTEK